jgi:Putative DNA-binding domain
MRQPAPEQWYSIMSTDLFADDLSRLDNEALFLAIERFAAVQPSEGWRHDYTVQWDDDSGLKNVAGFANTFGGVLLVGVRKGKKDATCTLVGVESTNELKTGIASSIAANLSPIPSYDIFECSDPSGPTKRFCIVRVRSGTVLHLMTKKGLQPVYVRNEDETIPANAAQLRRLVDRERQFSAQPNWASDRAKALLDNLKVNSGYANIDSDEWFFGPRQQSPTFLKLALMPTETIALEMDEAHERSLRNFVAATFPRLAEGLSNASAKEAEAREANLYEYVWYHKRLDREMRWRITGESGIASATQMGQEWDGKRCWSLVDLVTHTLLSLKLGIRWWEFVRYFGEGRLLLQMDLSGLELATNSSGEFRRAFYSTGALGGPNPRISADAISLARRAKNSTDAEVRVNYFSVSERLVPLTTSLMNQALRGLGHGVSVQRLERDVQALAESLV